MWWLLQYDTIIPTESTYCRDTSQSPIIMNNNLKTTLSALSSISVVKVEHTSWTRHTVVVINRKIQNTVIFDFCTNCEDESDQSYEFLCTFLFFGNSILTGYYTAKIRGELNQNNYRLRRRKNNDNKIAWRENKEHFPRHLLSSFF